MELQNTDVSYNIGMIATKFIVIAIKTIMEPKNSL